MAQVEVIKNGDGFYSLKGDLNRDTVMKCWEGRDAELSSLRGKVQEIQVDLAEIENVDTAGLAWIVHLTKYCLANELVLKITQVPSSIINLATLSNLETNLPIQSTE